MIFEKLKEQTAEIHREIEKSNTIMSPNITRELYADYLAKILPFIENAEQEIFAQTQAYHDELALETRMKSGLLKSDLNALGGRESKRTSYAPYHLKNLSEALGALYVLEGSTLGGTVISKYLKEKLNLTQDEVKYFVGYAEKTGKMWMDFKYQVLNQTIVFDEDQMIQGALKTFRKYNEVLSS